MLGPLLTLFLIPCTCLFSNDAFSSTIRNFIDRLLGDEEDEDTIVSTEHSILIDGEKFSYTAIAGTIPQFYREKEAGELFFTAYLKKDEEESHRPVTFVFNGGPGGSSLSMHIGGLGPKRLLLPEEGLKTTPPYQMIDNPQTLLVDSDLVFIDPMGTGYSREEKEGYKYRCYGVEGDLDSFVEFIRIFCSHFDKWNHPKYLLGASYGTTRACGLAERLCWSGISLNGLILMSSAIDFATLVGERDQALSDSLLIPSFAATAWYHGRTMQDKTLEEVVDYARRFVIEKSAPFLFQPAKINSVQQKEYYQQLADLIGLPLDTIRRYGSRIDEHIYTKEFMAAERKVIGGLDSRYSGDISTIAAEFFEDPSYRDLGPAFYPSFMNYLQGDLNMKKEALRYEDFSIEALHCWNWSSYDSYGLPNFMQRLRRTLIYRPAMKVFVGSGYFDLRTPIAAVEYSLSHLDLPISYQDNFQIEYYKGGHGFIFNIDMLKKFQQDMHKFYSESL